MWLATISVRWVRLELRPALALWQCAAADALARWAGGMPADRAREASAFTDQLRHVVRTELARAGLVPPPARPARHKVRTRSDVEHAFIEGFERASLLSGRARSVRDLLDGVRTHPMELQPLAAAMEKLLQGQSAPVEKALGWMCRAMSKTSRDGLRLCATARGERARAGASSGSASSRRSTPVAMRQRCELLRPSRTWPRQGSGPFFAYFPSLGRTPAGRCEHATLFSPNS